MSLEPADPLSSSSGSSASTALPRLVLRVGFAGTRGLPPDTSVLEKKLSMVFAVIAQRLVEIAPGTPIKTTKPVGCVADFYSGDIPLIRCITGLCEGADALASRTLHALAKHAVLGTFLETQLAAVIPFDLGKYRDTRPAHFHKEFDEQAASCAYILALDGCYEKPQPDTSLAKARRARAYRAQGSLLLRQADLLVAVADPGAEGHAGGTMETVSAALAFNLPVVFVHGGSGAVSILGPGEDPGILLDGLTPEASDWPANLERLVTRLTADPDTDAAHTSVDHAYDVSLLKEYFGKSGVPPVASSADSSPGKRVSFGERLWTVFMKRCQPDGERPRSDHRLEPYGAWRARSTTLNAYYSGNYRGTFLLNYLLAALAVALAAFSLVLFGYEHHAQPTETSPASASLSVPAAIDFILLSLLALGIMKFCIVIWIYRNTHRANHGNWNDRAVDYRYLAERLRAMFYLPLIGSFQPPSARPAQHATRAVRQSAVDWLLNAIVRSVSPAALDHAKMEMFAAAGQSYPVTILQHASVETLACVRDRWVWEQSVYHDRTARTMERFHLFAESWSKVCNVAVIVFVGADIALICSSALHWLPVKWEPRVHAASPGLIFFAALLPAIVASLNGIRFQSECRRLAERSAVMRTILRGRNPPPQPATRGSHSKSGQILRGVMTRFLPVAVYKLWSKAARGLGDLGTTTAQFLRSLFIVWSDEAPGVLPVTSRGGLWNSAQNLGEKIQASVNAPGTDPGSWAVEVLRLTESVAEAFVQETAEWSVLYAKELPEP